MSFREFINKDRFEGKVAIVTGAGSGIGKGVSLRLAKEGATVVASDVNFDAAKATSELVKEMGVNSLPIKVDVSNTDEIKEMVQSAVKAFGKIDILVNCAGVTTREPLLELNEEDWNREVNIDLKGTAFCIKYAALEMKKAGGGKIVNISSVAALIGCVAPAYSAAKGGIISLTKVLAGEFAPYKINVNSICPGFVATAINEKLRKVGMNQAILDKIPWGRWGTPEDIAALIAFLVSDEADYITGSIIQIDGAHASYMNLGSTYFEADKM